MPSDYRIRIYDKDGTRPVDVVAAAVWSWEVSDTGRLDFDMSSLDAKCQEKYLRPGNLVLIQHTLLPDWVGVIDAEQSWKFGEVSVNARTADIHLDWRDTPMQQIIKGSAGALFKKLLHIANRQGGTVIAVGNVFLGGSTDREEILNDSVLTHVKSIARNSGNDYDVTPLLDINGRLSLIGNWYKKLVSDSGLRLRWGYNLARTDNPLTYRGPIWNSVRGYGDASTSGTRLTSLQEDETSKSLYGLRRHSETFPGNVTHATLVQNTKQYLQEYKDPFKAFDVTALNVGDTFTKLRPGSLATLEMPGMGFTNGVLGDSAAVRVMVMEYDNLKDTVRLGLAATV
jgi:hypothetical protein